MKKLTEKETLLYLIQRLTHNLLELQEGLEETDFIQGERTAYVECMEWLQRWRAAEENGLDYEIEKRFPL